jgi:opacity protein-like surface antigen
LTVKKLLLGSALSLATLTGAAAADLPVYKEAGWSWTGCYLGAQAGGGSLSDSFVQQTGLGALAGGQVGCNYQMHRLVFGVEADGWWSSLKTNFHFEAFPPVVDQIKETRVNAAYDVALRAGIAFDRAFDLRESWRRFGSARRHEL